MIILFALLIIFMTILFLPLRVKIKYNNKLSYSLSLGGIPVPIPKKGKKKHVNYKEKEHEAAKNIKEDTHKDFSDNLEKLAAKISKYIDILKTVLYLTKKYIRMDKLMVQISSGTGEAASTAVCVGILWGSVYNVIGLIGEILTIDIPTVNINPDYEKASFKAYAKCIISTRIVYIILIGIIILFKSVRKDKEV